MRFCLCNGEFCWLMSWILINISAAYIVDDVKSREPKSLEKYLLKLDSKISYNMKTINDIEGRLGPLQDYPKLLQPIRDEVQGLKRMIGLQKSTSKSSCDSNPCLFGGKCSPTSDGRDYECTGCPFPTTGKNCESLSCGDECFRSKNTVYIIHRYLDVTWSEAKAMCDSKGTTMAMFKDGPAHLFVKQKLNALYAHDESKTVCFWLGLRRDNVDSPWKWVDGSPLSGYEGWAFQPIHKEKCANIGSTKRFQFNWDADPCTRVKGWTYYALCQKDLGALE